jgi:hypothetical protein
LSTSGRSRSPATHLAGRDTSRFSQPVHPVDRHADPNPELFGRLIARQAAALDRSSYPLANLQRVRFAYPCQPPSSQHGESETR